MEIINLIEQRFLDSFKPGHKLYELFSHRDSILLSLEQNGLYLAITLITLILILTRRLTHLETHINFFLKKYINFNWFFSSIQNNPFFLTAVYALIVLLEYRDLFKTYFQGDEWYVFSVFLPL